MIIVAGDHGTHGYRWESKFRRSRISLKIQALDQLGILMAIRAPKATDVDIFPNKITNVNLFRYVFALMSDSDDILSTLQPDNGYIGKREVLKDGVLQDKWKQYRR